MTKYSGEADEKKMLMRLQQILLKEDRDDLDHLKATLNNPNLLSEKVGPIIEERLDFLKQNFPREFRQVVEKIVEEKFETSQEELLNAIYPTLGLMIKKYIRHQFELLKESLENQIQDTLNTGILGRIRYTLFGVEPKKMSEAIIVNLNAARIEEIFVIEHHSGILLGSASRQERTDLDMIAGMLTAIKSFVEDAFNRGDEELELIQYGTFSIFIQNFPNYYIAAALSGPISAKDKEAFSEAILKFAQKELRIKLKKADGSSNLIIKEKLERYFIESPPID